MLEIAEHEIQKSFLAKNPSCVYHVTAATPSRLPLNTTANLVYLASYQLLPALSSTRSGTAKLTADSIVSLTSALTAASS